MKGSIRMLVVGTAAALTTSLASGSILGSHAFTWWDDPQLGVTVKPLGAPAPSAASAPMFDLNEWHLDQAQTTQWYAGAAIAGLPTNPFNAANRSGLLGGIPAVAGAQAFVYRIQNRAYISGNFLSFSDPAPPGPGVNYLSGINIIDTGGALAISAPSAGSQFMFTTQGGSKVLDMTPGSLGGPQDWDFNAFAGPGNFEWDIRPGVNAAAPNLGVLQGAAGVFGFAMPGKWFDQVNNGWVHSWNVPPSSQVNISPTQFGFSGPFIPAPGGAALLTIGALTVLGGRRRA